MNVSMRRYLLAALVPAAIVLHSACSKGEVPAPPQESKPAATAQAPAMPPPVSSRGEQQLPPGHPPIDAAPQGKLPEVAPGMGAGEKGLVWSVPADWIQQTPSSSMRKAQYEVPGSAGAGECVVFYFGPGQGGDPKANAMRWGSQFKRADGSTAEGDVKTSQAKVGDLDVLYVEVSGTYAGGMTMGMQPAEEKPGYALLGAVAEGPDSNWFFKFTGPEATVKSQRAAFEGMIRSLKRGA